MGDGFTEADIDKALLEIGSGWGPVELLPPDGAMAKVGLALHYRATSPELSVHVKIYLPAEPYGTSDYLRQGSAKRIARLYQRFQELMNGDEIGNVPIRALRHSDDGLIVVMDHITLVESLFDQDPDGLRADTSRALRELDTHRLWLHFDICPKNVGRTSKGTYCYVDLESLFRVGERSVPVSETLSKWLRIPPDLQGELATELNAGNGLSPELAERFQNHQLARLAMDMFAGGELEGADVEEILAKGQLDHADMWDKHVVQLVKRGQAPNPKTLADAIEKCVGQGGSRRGFRTIASLAWRWICSLAANWKART